MSVTNVDHKASTVSVLSRTKAAHQTVHDFVDEIAMLLLQDIKNNVLMDDLAKRSGWSSRSIAYAFTRRYGLPPKQWLQRERISLARDILMSSSDKICLARLAAELGFTSPSKFGVYYRRIYGETPRDTIRSRLGGRQKAA